MVLPKFVSAVLSPEGLNPESFQSPEMVIIDPFRAQEPWILPSLPMQDLFTSLTSASKPHHMLSESGVILGYSHFGMLAAARWVLQQTKDRLEQALTDHPGYPLQVIGHSLGAGTAALLTTRSPTSFTCGFTQLDTPFRPLVGPHKDIHRHQMALKHTAECSPIMR